MAAQRFKDVYFFSALWGTKNLKKKRERERGGGGGGGRKVGGGGEP